MKEKIILGLGDNIDYEIVWDSGIFEKLIAQYNIYDKELLADIEITSERDLVVSILGFLKSETGGERFVSSPNIIDSFTRNFKNKITLGGTSVRAAIAMRKLGYTSALHLVTINDHVRRLIPPDCLYVCSNTADSSYPHLIVQFYKDTRVKANDIDICTNRANRIIYNNDRDNIVMELDEGFSELITEAKVFLVSGFNAMQSKELLSLRLKSLLSIMDKLPENAWVYYEDACFYDESFSKIVQDALTERIDIYSLNEDELQHYLGRELDLLNPYEIKDALEDVGKLIHVPMIVVHSKYWALAYGDNAESVSRALKGGITMATTRFRFGDDFSEENYNETEGLCPEEEGTVIARELKKLLGDKVCCIPSVKVQEQKVTTIGLGDAFVGGFLPALLT
ncbi:phosphofructokinase [Ruminiclostridium cellobioparum]|uniref:Archaeal ADP-dependent phosphofructokinase/glucokinase n=1 Tax=Ruminiclostridium cellobioparum subsp. termitidis CT1112 TaxID=1195236 RepID=S0FJ78_RUMCE|nr:phosphofructokinase [Ruminiclostridium cellobioparum]EMS70296.1 Archaeal ADP-dependent phosphofructokinase/glucokinase [Ruminiclostridium cellobioparum subsp. termitidis CT1112]